MRFLAVLILVIFSGEAFAQNTVDSEKEAIAKMERELQERREALKNKEKVDSAKNSELEQIRKQRLELEAKEKSLLEANVSKSEVRVPQLRKRDYYIDAGNFLTLVLSDRFKTDTIDRNRSRQNGALEGGWNFVNFEVGPLFGFENYDASTYKETSTTYGVNAAYNIFPNEPGQDLIPFVNLRLYQTEYEFDHNIDPTEDSKERAFVYEVGAGARYFPFGEYLALTGMVYYRDADGKFNITDYSSKGVRATGSLYIYF